MGRQSERDRKLSHKFAETYLRQDGVFLLKLIASNSTDIVTSDLVTSLWDNYRNKGISRSQGEEEEGVDTGDWGGANKGDGGGVEAGP